MTKFLISFMFLASIASNLATAAVPVYQWPHYFSEGPTSLSLRDQNNLSCEMGQSDYQGMLLQSVFQGAPKTPTDYYAIATHMGYFAKSPNDPIEVSEIAEKVKPTIDKDLNAMNSIIKNNGYLLFVGELGWRVPEVNTEYVTKKGMHRGHPSTIPVLLPIEDGGNHDNPTLIGYTAAHYYDVDTKTVSMQAENSGDYLDKKIPVSLSDWKEKFADNVGKSEVDMKAHLGGRILLNSKLEVVLAEIFVKSTGKTLLRMVAKGQDETKLAALVPETPRAEYKYSSCESLNPDYFSNKNAVEDNAKAENPVKNFFKF